MEKNLDTKLIPLTQGKFAIVDAEDFDQLSQYKWQAKKDKTTFYAVRSEKGTTIKMHRQILNAPKGLCCDHKNHNGLDNRRSNLRLCTNAQNQYNQRPRNSGSSRYKGVCRQRGRKRWQAEIGFEGRLIHIGCYDYEIDAAIAYDDMAVELFGEFACLNFDYRPEIREWIERTCLFNPTSYELAGANLPA